MRRRLIKDDGSDEPFFILQVNSAQNERVGMRFFQKGEAHAQE